MFRNIPLIDFDPFLNGTDEDRQKVSSKIGDACRNVGFFYLSNYNELNRNFDLFIDIISIGPIFLCFLINILSFKINKTAAICISGACECTSLVKRKL